MKLRIRKTEMGFLTEVQKVKWFGFKKYWTHYCHVFGLPNEPWYFSSFNHALTGLLDKVKWDALSESYSAGTYCEK